MSLKSICQVIATERDLHPEMVYDLARQIFDAIEASAIESGHCVVRPFGTFRLVKSSPRQARNPKTNEPMALPERHKLTFAHGKGRKAQLQRLVVHDKDTTVGPEPMDAKRDPSMPAANDTPSAATPSQAPGLRHSA